MDKLIITVALTGNVPTKQMNPNLPATADEIALWVTVRCRSGAWLLGLYAHELMDRGI